MSQELLNIFMAFFYVSAVIFMMIFISFMAIQERKNLDAMRKNLILKLSEGIELSAKDVVHIGRAFSLPAHQARQVVYKIYSEANTKEEFDRLQDLVIDIEKEEPFDDLPDEVKPSMVRLTKLTDNTGEGSDKHLLAPISQTLNKYVDLKSEQEKQKKQTYRAYVVTIISFVFGAVSTYYSITAPSAEEIVQKINKASVEK